MVAAIYQGYIADENGAIIEGASVEVRDQDTNAIVDLWSNRATTSTKTNPTTTDANGYYFFYRTAGRYKITVTSGAYSATFNNVSIGTAQEYDTGTDAGDIPLNSDLATVAGTGDYDDLINKPTLGTIVSYNYGTAGGEVQTNSLNDARFFRIGNNLSEGTASAMRANLELGSGDAVAFAQVNADNIRIDGNTISSTDTNGNITIDPDGTGTVEIAGTTNVTGAITATGNITSRGAANVHQASGDLDTTGLAYTSFQDNSTGSYVERGWIGFGFGDGDIDVNNSAGDVHLRVSGTRSLTATSTGVDVTGAITATTFAKVGSYTVAGAATLGAATAGAGAIIYVSDETGGAVLAFSDGTDWRRVTDRTVIA